MTRHESRQEAFCLLFEKTFTDMDLDEIIQGATETRDLQVNDFTLKLAKGTIEHLDEIDQLIESKLKNWKLSRIYGRCSDQRLHQRSSRACKTVRKRG